MKRVLILLYGALCYVVFLGILVYAIGFIGGFAVPRTLDGDVKLPLARALAIDFALLALFAVQHSGMARPSFKRGLMQVVPEAAERSTYVLASSAVLALLFWQWQPVGGVVWSVEGAALRASIVVTYGIGWALLVYVTFLIDHFDLFGVRQAWNAWREKPHQAPKFRTPGLYRWVRHPLYVGWLLIFWATPTMTVSHLLFAAATTLYILVAIHLEERDLVQVHGADYARYREVVPMLFPRIRRTLEHSSAAAQPRR